MKKETKRKMKAAAAAGMLGVATLFSAGGCEHTVTEYKYRDVPVEDTGEDKSVMCGEFNGIEVYKEVGVTYQQVNAFFLSLASGYYSLSTAYQNIIKDKVKEIRVDLDSIASCVPDGSGKYVVGFAIVLDDWDVASKFTEWVESGKMIGQAQQKDVIRLANFFDSSKVHASVPDTKFS